jgi:hypothetical protein
VNVNILESKNQGAFFVLALLILVTTSILNYNPSTYSQSCISQNTQDVDGDNIPNDWEVNGVDANKDGRIDMNLSARESNPLHKDIFLEIDYMRFHQPYSQVIPKVIEAFDRAPVCNPDGSNGIKLHVQLDQEIPHQDSLTLTELTNGNAVQTWKGFDDTYTDYFGTPSERNNTNAHSILVAKEMIYHYAIFGHTFDNQGYSGISRGIPAMDFVVTLGKFLVRDPVTGHVTGSPSEQEGTLMHELGHNLNLGHGGVDHTNCKPNYLSIMNYLFQFPYLVSSRPLDYSPYPLLSLNEDALDETSGIGISISPGVNPIIPPNSLTVYGPREPRIALTGAPIDWNRDTDLLDKGIREDISYIRGICDYASPDESLQGYDDWSNLIYNSVVYEAYNVEGTTNFAGGLDSNTTTTSEFNSSGIKNDMLDLRSKAGNQSFTPIELTYQNVKNMNLGLVSSINTAIDNLPASSFEQDSPLSALSDEESSTTLEDVKDFYADEIGIPRNSNSALSDEPSNQNDTSIIGYIRSDNITGAISSLQALLPSLDSSFGGAQSDDQITDPSAQKQIAALINNAIEGLRSQTCSHSDCTSVNKHPNSTIEY